MYIINFRFSNSVEKTVHSVITSSFRLFNYLRYDSNLEILELKVIKEEK